nr:hypothetical protein BaRGS_015605 [Batillaria attramentaria]
MFQCPQHDDELYCDVTCPENCTCYGMAFFCGMPFNASMHPGLRFLDASGSGMTPASLVDNIMLVHLSLARCGLRQLDDLNLPNLLSLDVSDNMLNNISDTTLARLTRLQALYLSGNPMTSFFPQLAFTNLTFPDLKILHVAGIVTRELHVIVYTTFPNVQHLNLSHTRLERMPSEGFRPMKQLRDLDLRGCPMTVFSRGLLQGLDKLRTVYADNYKVCCPATLPDGFNENSCHAPSDEVSSCDSLLRAEVYRVFLSTFAIMAILGNIASFVYRLFISKIDKRLGYDVFVTHLSLSDFLMGVYLAVIGVADRVYRGNYLWEDTDWKNSAACKAAGFVSLLSSEVSAFIICLITLDRFLVIRFPVSDFRFLKWSANVACAVAWVAGLALAAVPLLPVTSHWQFYGQNGICLPLPITRREFPGHDYSFGVMIVLNFVLFLLIAVGQILIYWSITASRTSVNDSVRRSRDMAIARRLFAIVMTDFLCWFPIGLLGLLASNGVPISGEANVVMAIFVLPLNSALNPFLYTFNMVMEKRRKARDERMRETLMAQPAEQKCSRRSGRHTEEGAHAS